MRYWSAARLNVGRFESAFDQIGALFADHYNRCVSIARNYGRHYRAIDHSETFDSVDPELWIDNSHGVVLGPHLSGAHRMVDCLSVRPRQTLQVWIAIRLVLFTAIPRPRPKPHIELVEGLRERHFQGYLQGIDQHFGVVGVLEVCTQDFPLDSMTDSHAFPLFGSFCQ